MAGFLCQKREKSHSDYILIYYALSRSSHVAEVCLTVTSCITLIPCKGISSSADLWSYRAGVVPVAFATYISGETGPKASSCDAVAVFILSNGPPASVLDKACRTDRPPDMPFAFDRARPRDFCEESSP